MGSRGRGEAARGEPEALAVSAGDIFARGRGIEGPAGRGRGLSSLDLPSPERAGEVAGENDAARVPLSEPLFDELLGATLRDHAHFGAKAGLAERHRHASDSCARPVPPSCSPRCSFRR